MSDDLHQSKRDPETPPRDDLKAGVTTGATLLGCLLTATLPWSILVIVFIVFVIAWCTHHLLFR